MREDMARDQIFQAQRIELVRPQDLTAHDESMWSAIVAARPDLSGPYFDIRYVKAIGPGVPHAGVARFYEGDKVAGYFAWQKRGKTLLPMGAPLSDYHAVIAAEGFTPDFDGLMKATGTKRLEFQGWVGEDTVAGTRLTRRLADATAGYDAWWTAQNAQHHKFFKNVGRCQRNVEKDFGGFAFTWEQVTPELMDWVIGLKREQYKKTGMHDVFGCGWTRAMLDALAQSDDTDFGLRAGVFRHDGRLVAVEIALVQADEVHLWFPAYDPAYARYSVGILLTVAIIKNTESLGLKRFDFGTGGEDYKSPMTIAGDTCYDGERVLAVPLATRVLDAAALVMPKKRFAERFERLRLSLRRRVKVIRATETGLTGWGRALISLSQRGMMRLGAKPAHLAVVMTGVSL